MSNPFYDYIFTSLCGVLFLTYGFPDKKQND